VAEGVSLLQPTAHQLSSGQNIYLMSQKKQKRILNLKVLNITATSAYSYI